MRLRGPYAKKTKVVGDHPSEHVCFVVKDLWKNEMLSSLPGVIGSCIPNTVLAIYHRAYKRPVQKLESLDVRIVDSSYSSTELIQEPSEWVDCDYRHWTA